METKSNIKEIYETAVEKMKNANFSTGFSDLDIFCQYLAGGDILTIGGRPAMGKTNFAISLTNHFLEKNKKVIFFSVRHSSEQLVQKLLAEKIGVPVYSLAEESVQSKDICDAIKFFDGKEFYIDDTSKTSDEIEAMVKEIKPDIIVVDYVQLLEMPKAPNLTEATNLAIKEIKRIAVENNVVVVLLSQLSRAVESRCDKRPLLSDLRNGSLLEELSSTIIFIYREAYYDAMSEYPLNQIIVAKNIMCPTGVVCLDFKNGFFRNLPSDDTF